MVGNKRFMTGFVATVLVLVVVYYYTNTKTSHIVLNKRCTGTEDLCSLLNEISIETRRYLPAREQSTNYDVLKHIHIVNWVN